MLKNTILISYSLDSKDSNESQHYDEESNPSGKKSDQERKKPTSLMGWIKQLWPKIEGQYQTFLCKIKKIKYKESL